MSLLVKVGRSEEDFGGKEGVQALVLCHPIDFGRGKERGGPLCPDLALRT